ncbi:MAG: DNA repair exonuclease [Oscillospiraceae bacterium]|nr:DNA repair exonuclease [Oscillospiraceae bacterium]
MAKVLCTSDIHLDSPFAELSPEEQKVRRESLRNIFSKIIDIANEEKVDALLITGDIFDSYPIRPETLDSFFRDICRAKTKVFITPGNHDPYTAESPYRTLSFPENVHLFTESKLTPVELPECKLRIFGAAHPSPWFDDRIMSGFKVPDDDFTNIVMIHSELNCTEKYCPVSVDEIAACGADYVNVGHIHIPTEILKAGNTYYAYCGCPECRNFKDGRDSGIYIGEVGRGYVNLTHRRISDYCYRDETVNTNEYPDIVSALPTPFKHEYLRLTLVGESESIDTDTLKEKLLETYEEVTIYDRTTLPRDIWEGLSDEGLRGVFLRKMKAQLDSCEDETEKKKILLAAKLGIDAMENREI